MIKLKYKELIPTMAILTSILITACGGGDLTVADGGISGTGITMGRITNFGSIIVNGVEFDVDNAILIRDESPSTGQEEFSVGEFVVIKGSVDANGTIGTADEVIFTNEIEGAVTTVDLVNNTIEVLGQQVIIDQLTVFIGFNVLGDLQAGNIIEVSGVKDSSGVIKATSVKFKSAAFIDGDSENELKGIVTSIDLTAKTFLINTITIEYANATLEGFSQQQLQSGQFVEVESSSMIVADVLIADKIELKEGEDLEEGTEANIEGQVTRFVSITDFDINGLAATTNASTEYSNGVVSDLFLGVSIDLEGEADSSGIIVAESISFEGNDGELDEIEGFIDSIQTSSSQIAVSGQIVVIDASTIMVDDSDLNVSPLTINDLSITDKVEIKGFYLADGRLQASKLERKDAEE
jgi:hypothetical protein